MRTICKGIFLILLVSFCVRAQSGGQSLPDKIRPSIVTVISYDGDGKVIRQGTGLIVSEEGDCLAHKLLVEDVSRAEVRTYDGQTYAVVKLISRDGLSGMVLFSAAIPKDAAVPAKVGKAAPKPGEAVSVAVLDEASGQRLIESTVSRSKSYRVWENIEIGASLPKGSLGNPVFNAEGEFIGMVSFQSGDDDSITAYAGKRLSNMIEEMLMSKTSESDGKIAGPLSDKGVKIIGAVIQGKAKKRVRPRYPSQAKDRHISGTVVVELLVDETGKVLRARTIRSSFQRPMNVSEADTRAVIPYMKKAAEEAALKWEFEPTTLDGAPVKVLGTITFNFSM